MASDRNTPNLSLPAALFALAAVPGALALASTDARIGNADLVDGSYQRVYEDRFQKELPGRDLAIHAWNAVAYGVLGEAAEGAVPGSDGWLFTAEEFQDPVDAPDLWDELERARARLANEGAELVPVIVPDKARIMAQHLPVQRSERFQSRYQMLLGGLAARGFAAIDLRPALAAGKSSGFMKTDTHWSPSGAQLAARAISEAVAGYDMPKSDFATRRVGTSDFEGDLLAFVDLGPFREKFTALHDVIDVFETDAVDGGSAGGLFDDVTIPVALVGTSYSARPEFHFEGFLKSELDADLVNYAEVGLGPFAPMDRFLETLGAATSAPRLVIWEIPERYINTWRVE